MQFSHFIALAAVLVVTLTVGARVRMTPFQKAAATDQNAKAGRPRSDSDDDEASAPKKRRQEGGEFREPDHYDEIYADTVCSGDAEEICPQCKLARKTAKCDAYRAGEKVDVETFPIRLGLPEHGLPEELQGVFWLTKQGSSSALVSFGKNSDGGGLSVLDENGVGKVRVAGDRVWSFHDLEGNYATVENMDLVYYFNFDSSTTPRKCSIHPQARNYGIGNGIKLNKYTEWILNFEMDLLQCPKNVTTSKDPYCQDLIPEFQDSFVWQRRSYILGIHVTSADYKAVQVIKADGTKLPAFYKWLEYCGDPVTGGTPGEFHYHEIDNNKKCMKQKSWVCLNLGILC